MPIVDDYLLSRSSPFALGSIEEGRTDLTLTQSAAANGRVRGSITNASNGAPLNNATVKLSTQAGDPVEHTLTNPVGRYSFSGVAPGSYRINATLEGFLTSAAQTFTIYGNQIIEINIPLTPAVVTNTIYGIITDLSTGDPIEGANVVLLTPGTTQNVVTVKSNASGQYIMSDIPDGTRTLFGAAFGYYVSSFIPIDISGGSIISSDIAMQAFQYPQATVNGYIKNQSGGAIDNACVGLYLLNPQDVEILQQVTFTDSTGFYIFGRVSAGTYVIKSKSEKTVTTIG